MRRSTYSLALLLLVVSALLPLSSHVFAKPTPPPIHGILVTHEGTTLRTDPNQPVLDRYGRPFLPDPRVPKDQFPKPPTQVEVSQAEAREQAMPQLAGGGPPQAPRFFHQDRLVAPLGSWLESIDVLDPGQTYPRVVGNTSFYFDPEHDNRLYSWAPDGPESLSYTEVYSVPAPMQEGRTMELGDLNGDGHLDAVVTFGYNNPVDSHRVGIVWGPSFSSHVLIDNNGDNPFGVEFVKSAGKDIALITNWNSTFVTVLSWDGTQVVQSSLSAPQAGFNRQIHGDVDGDGDDDVAVFWGQSRNIPLATIYYNNNDGSMSRGPDIPRYENAIPDALGMGDLDGDGIPEFIGAQGGNTGIMAIYKRTAMGQYINTTLFYGWGLSVPNHIWVDDLNQDGINDILSLYSGGELVTFPAYAPGVFGQYRVHDASLYATWFDTDGARYVPFGKNRFDRKSVLMANYNYGVSLWPAADNMPQVTWIQPEPVVEAKIYTHPDQATLSFEGYGSSFAYTITDLATNQQVWSGAYAQPEGVLTEHCFFGQHGTNPCPGWPASIREGGQKSYRLTATATNDLGETFTSDRTIITQFEGSVLLPKEVVKTASPTVVHPSDIVTYTITITNPYSVPLTGWVEDTLPSELKLENANGGTYDPGRHEIRWRGQTVPAGGKLEITFTMRVPGEAQAQLNVMRPNAAFSVTNSAYSYCPADAIGRVSYQCQGGPPTHILVTTPGVVAPQLVTFLALVTR